MVSFLVECSKSITTVSNSDEVLTVCQVLFYHFTRQAQELAFPVPIVQERERRHRFKPRQSSPEPLSLALPQTVIHSDILRQHFVSKSKLCLAYVCIIFRVT